ncbi:short chain dehydrogenase [Geodermatophilus sp. TF02-6]|uniref:SDR family oxidoreductase n=1 Tax=Geodermatophilus sp. TF02-6 TaxID=2250575 RepID=UPI000DEBB903|nr:SDR family oxidoreductase [Geodermatophilus sp. TF02-6]RBY79897.1 short chain dehydrogenase [Geodermatophilus sp. TF02-6]
MRTPNFRLDGGTAVVTGAAGGIGARVALGLAASGADVACIDLSAESLQETVTAIREGGGRAVAIAADTTDHDQMSDAVATAQGELGPVRYAANCAGINNGAPAEEMPLEQWRRLIDVNLTGVFVSCQLEGRAMLQAGGGSIVNIGSISALIANRGLTQAHYNASKAGVVHLTSSLALEWARRGIRVNTVSPGYTKTPMATHPDVWEHVKAYADDIPLGRWAEADEMVGPVTFLLSEASSYCTGSNLMVDGGAICW